MSFPFRFTGFHIFLMEKKMRRIYVFSVFFLFVLFLLFFFANKFNLLDIFVQSLRKSRIKLKRRNDIKISFFWCCRFWVKGIFLINFFAKAKRIRTFFFLSFLVIFENTMHNKWTHPYRKFILFRTFHFGYIRWTCWRDMNILQMEPIRLVVSWSLLWFCWNC